MRLLVIFSLMLLGLGGIAMAQDTNAVLYDVEGVSVDVTAKTATQARDGALTQAQHTAFAELMSRLGVADSFTRTMNDDDIAATVQSFEVQNERSSAVRYIGTFNIRFKPNTVRNLLTKSHVAHSEVRSRPYIVMPISNLDGKPVLWEDTTAWRTAWAASPSDSGIVPVIIPAGGPDDVSLLSTADAVEGKNTAIKSLMDKYSAAGALFATLTVKVDDPTAYIVTLKRFDSTGAPVDSTTLTMPPTATKQSAALIMAQIVTKTRTELDKEWRTHPEDTTLVIDGSGASAQPAEPQDADVSIQNMIPNPTAMPAPANDTPTAHMAVGVSIVSLADWTMLKHKLESTPGVAHVNVLSLQRGTTSIDLEYRGTMPNLQQSIALNGMTLALDTPTQTWTLKRSF